MGRTKYEIPDRPFITTDYMRKRYGKFDPNVFKRWEKDEKVEKIRNGLYLNDDFELRGDMDRFLIAQKMYQPSYVSLHSALGYYGIIPEYVYHVTSISTRKTKDFEYDGANYSYRQVNSAYFFGYETLEWRGEYLQIATREKALLDLAYLEPNFSDPDWLIEMRFDEDEINALDWTRMLMYGNLIESQTVLNRITLLLDTYAI